MLERGWEIDHATINRWVLCYAPELEKRTRRYLCPATGSYRIDETYIKIKGEWRYRYRALDRRGQTIDFMLSAKRDKRAAKQFFEKVTHADHATSPYAMNVDRNPAFPPAFRAAQRAGILPKSCKLRRVTYLNNVVEQDHRFIKRLVRPMMGHWSFWTANRTLRGMETLHMPQKGQTRGVAKADVLAQARFVSTVFGVAT